MQIPNIDDTIVGVSSGWTPAAVGIVRASGPGALALVAGGSTLPVDAVAGLAEIRVEVAGCGAVPATALCFRSPRSYTGQDLVELHVPGSLPLLRTLAGQLIAAGARRALPGEFTARAFMAGKLDIGGVEDVLAIMRGAQRDTRQHTLRADRQRRQGQLAALGDELTGLLARIEAGIDFVEEADVSFVPADEVRARLESALQQIGALREGGAATTPRDRPHVALAGLPNAGKSTLFNRLVGSERALVSPVVGTTRDVVAAEVTLADRRVVLQDCAGLGASTDELELATYRATERAADQADVVLWLHAADVAWTDAEQAALDRLAASRVLVVCSKADLVPATALEAWARAPAVRVEARDASGLKPLEDALAAELDRLAAEPATAPDADELVAAEAALAQILPLAGRAGAAGDLADPELVALDLRVAVEKLRSTAETPLDETLLGRIFQEFCVGK